MLSLFAGHIKTISIYNDAVGLIGCIIEATEVPSVLHGDVTIPSDGTYSYEFKTQVQCALAAQELIGICADLYRNFARMPVDPRRTHL